MLGRLDPPVFVHHPCFANHRETSWARAAVIPAFVISPPAAEMRVRCSEKRRFGQAWLKRRGRCEPRIWPNSLR